MEEVRLTGNEAILYALIPAGVGFLLGLVPLVAGFIKGKVRLGVFGLIASTLGGALLGFILSIPAMAVFTWLIVRDGFVADDVASDAPPTNSDEDRH
jgi:hypothetical protein